MTEVCVYHAGQAAIERCEVCGRPLCGQCLWYAADGRRLCEMDARLLADAGISVTPPEAYAEAIPASLSPSTPPPPADLPYRGNTFDLASLIAGILGITTLASCTGLAYCLPFVAGIIGLYAFLNAEQSTNPKRTRMVAGIGIAAAALMLFFLVLIVLFMLFGIAMSFISSSP